MRTASLLASATALLVGLAPMSAFAATATTDVSEDDVLKVLDESSANLDGRGGGGGGIY